MMLKSTYEKLILVMILFQVFVDSFQGFVSLYLNVSFGFSQVYKVTLFFICLFYIFSKRHEPEKESYQLVSFLMLFGVLVLIIHLLGGAEYYLIQDASQYIKMITTIVVFFTVSKFSIHDPIRFTNLWKTFIIIVLIFNILISVFGLGTYSYEDFGYKGYFYAANALSGTVVLVSAIVLSSCLFGKIYKYFLYSVLFLAIATAIGTKSGILGVLLLVIFLPIINGLIVKYSRFYLLLVSIVFGATFFAYSYIYSSKLVDRISYFYDNGGLIRAVFSGRNIFLEHLMPVFLSSNSLELLFGLGFSSLNQQEKPLVEIDSIDMLFIFGILGCLVYFICLFYIFNKVRRVGRSPNYCRTSKTLVKQALFVSLVLFFMANIAGHVIFNGMVTVYWGALLALPFWFMNYKKAMSNRYKENSGK